MLNFNILCFLTKVQFCHAFGLFVGHYPPTRGEVFIDGYDITKNITEIRENLGFCPQGDLLFNDLTLSEHLFFYSVVSQIFKNYTVNLPFKIYRYVILTHLTISTIKIQEVSSPQNTPSHYSFIVIPFTLPPHRPLPPPPPITIGQIYWSILYHCCSFVMLRILYK